MKFIEEFFDLSYVREESNVIFVWDYSVDNF